MKLKKADVPAWCACMPRGWRRGRDQRGVGRPDEVYLWRRAVQRQPAQVDVPAALQISVFDLGHAMVRAKRRLLAKDALHGVCPYLGDRPGSIQVGLTDCF